jgi:hypothetical protein
MGHLASLFGARTASTSGGSIAMRISSGLPKGQLIGATESGNFRSVIPRHFSSSESSNLFHSSVESEPESEFMLVDYRTQRMSALSPAFRGVDGPQLAGCCWTPTRWPPIDANRPVSADHHRQLRAVGNRLIIAEEGKCLKFALQP